MVQGRLDGSDERAHPIVWELLPWYANGTLSQGERAEVEAHLAHCELCSQELLQCRYTAESVRTTDDDVWEPSAQHFSEIMAGVERLPPGEASAPASDETMAGFLRRALAWLQGAPTGARVVFAAQGALVLVLATALIWPQGSSSPDHFRTFSDGATASPAKGARLRLVFAEDTTEKELRILLNSVTATIVEGPSRRGVYTVSLGSVDSEARDAALARLRNDDSVRLAEPVVSP
ncbi:MAG: zf-HC2 domain-containing protein [Gammaproteobacteria bacterium]|nr:zf-HC2 domain-containing protein [Gammaproteobacteria bacterium]